MSTCPPHDFVAMGNGAVICNKCSTVVPPAGATGAGGTAGATAASALEDNDILKEIQRDFKRVAKKQDDVVNIILRCFVATSQKRPVSTGSERAHNQEKFKEGAISRYSAQSSGSQDHIMCAVLGEYIRRDKVIAGHICSLQQENVLPILGFDISFKWSPMNCVLMYEPLEKLFDALQVTFLYHPDTQEITFQVLYDHLLSKPVVTDFYLFEKYSTMSKSAKNNFRKKFKTYKELNGRKLRFPSPLSIPSKALLHWAAKSAYTTAMASAEPHQCAIDSMPSEDMWAAIAGNISPSATRMQSFIEDDNLASDDEREPYAEDEKEEALEDK